MMSSFSLRLVLSSTFRNTYKLSIPPMRPEFLAVFRADQFNCHYYVREFHIHGTDHVLGQLLADLLQKVNAQGAYLFAHNLVFTFMYKLISNLIL